MAEVFSRAFLEPDKYEPNTWVNLYDLEEVNLTGAMVFDFSISNTSKINITIEVRLVDAENKIVHYILGPTELQGQGISWDSSHKIVMMPGDMLQVKASEKGISFYASIVTNLKMPA